MGVVDSVDAVVVGAGVVGLAIGRALARAGHETVVLEAEGAIGSITSSRNSEVIHGGLYYPTGSLKARLCVAGRVALYDFCNQYGVPYRRCGKLIVATSPAEADEVEALHAQAHRNGVDDVHLVTAAEMAAREPDLRSHGGLFSPSSGILDSHRYMLALRGDLEAHGGAVALHAPLRAAEPAGDRIALHVGGDEPTVLQTKWLINAAGLAAWAVSRAVAGMDAQTVPERHLAKGNYYALVGRSPFRHLVYPVPERGGLGVHLTLDLAGQARFGPDVEWVDAVDYTVDPRRADRFYAAIRRYWPGLPNNALVPAYAGLRPKITGPGAPAGDFIIHDPLVTGLPGYVALYGIESPGLTASLALADEVAGLCA